MLHMIRIGASQVYHDPLAAGINDVQELSKTHDAVSRAKTEVLHRILTHYLRCTSRRSTASATTAARTGSSPSSIASHACQHHPR